LEAYETLILIHPDADEERQQEIIGRVREIVLGGGGSWDALDPWGRRKLSYEIKKQGEAHHWLVQFTVGRDALAEVDRVLAITDGVLRHKIVRRRAAAAAAAT
jgi:small subunit ribosomal protein S6